MERCEDRPFYLLAGAFGEARFQLLSLKEVIRLTEDERQRVAASYRLSAASRRCCRGYTATFSWVTQESPNKQQRFRGNMGKQEFRVTSVPWVCLRDKPKISSSSKTGHCDTTASRRASNQLLSFLRGRRFRMGFGIGMADQGCVCSLHDLIWHPGRIRLVSGSNIK